ncbi:hypothetical protein IDJ75_10015 [Mucilaginibacter rigui]|uniref:DUF4412 domain-containing protein n=1 Tax=Mucilaginibacter rigui TaxID=534635 RepID=A0ABR7X4V8_9SPHI|nr:hypothetical protein [Mucilaginibacter rigui]MBD1385612.1 hypothetical protein [Mucilaginibacter rigui]
MKNKIFLMLLMAAGFSANAQTTEKKTKIDNVSLAVYNVDARNNEKEGIYAVKNLSNDGLWLQGIYKDDQRAGTWNFFNKDFKLAMRYNYDQKKLAFVDANTLKNVSVNVLSDDNKIKNGASAPLPICSVDYYLQLLANNIYGFSDSNNWGKDAEITAHIGTDGKATYSVIFMVDGKKSAKQNVKLSNDKFAIEWIPSMYNNKPVEAEFTAYVKIAADESVPDQTKRVRWDN